MAKVTAMLYNDTHILQNNCIQAGDYVFCGTRGWTFPQDAGFGENDKKIYEREKIRLQLSLDAAKKYQDKEKIVMMHFPPVYQNIPNTEYAAILEQENVAEVVFGHLHGDILNNINLTDFKVGTVNYNLVSADYLDFRLKRIR